MKKYISHILTILSVICISAGCSKDEDNNIIYPVTDLSENSTANCYIVPSAGSYSFKTVRGNTTVSVGNPASAVVLWESFGTDVKPDVGDIVKYVEYKDGYVTFTTPDQLNNGNALIAVKDADDNILWSWHIWVCKDYNPTKDNQQVYKNNAGVMMDRHLGATSATPGDIHAFGLLYQWGRKDPFLSAGRIPTGADVDGMLDQAASTLEWPSAVKSDKSTGTIEYAVNHPTTFISNSDSNSDWLMDNYQRWNNKKKTEYDPCPAGWKVPGKYNVDEDSYTIWRWSFSEKQWKTVSNWDKTNLGMDFAKTDKKLGSAECIWYPAAGCRKYSDGKLIYVGTCGPCWSSFGSDYLVRDSMALHFDNTGRVTTNQTIGRAFAASVRCVAE